MIDQIVDGLQRSCRRLLEEDGALFDCPIEEHAPYDARKLHEVCINHRFANILADEIVPLFEGPLFVDIEFNRNGLDFKNLEVAGEDRTVRPDIIIHNRRSGENKRNLLVVECKKGDVNEKLLREDQDKVQAFIADERYCYEFGAQVMYAKGIVNGAIFFKQGNDVSRVDFAANKSVQPTARSARGG